MIRPPAPPPRTDPDPPVSTHDEALPAPTLPGWTLRHLRPEDAPALQDLWERCTDYHQLQEGTPTRPTAAVDEIAALPPEKDRADKFLFGIHAADGTLAGMLDLIRDYPGPGEWWVGLLMLDPAARRAGIGADVYRAAEAWAAARGARMVQLAVLEQNAGAARFWERMGFEETRRQDYTSDTGHQSRVIVMVRVLAPEAGGAHRARAGEATPRR